MAIKKIIYWEYVGEDDNNSPIIINKEMTINEIELEEKITQIKNNYPQEPTIIDL
jgi:hypothetical protein